MKYFERAVIARALTQEALYGRMCFIAGPRQVGKTTAIQRFLKAQGYPQLYYNWDTATVKRRYAHAPIFFIEDIPPAQEQVWVALDEIHKYPQWKNILKGYYDEWHEKIHFIVTGSARLEFFRRSGDSLVGRYFLFRMLPLGVWEVAPHRASDRTAWFPGSSLPPLTLPSAEVSEAVDLLFHLTGYPEPLTVGTETFYNRWRENYCSLVIREDLRDLTKIVHTAKLETLLYLLPERVGGPLSLNALKQPLEAAYGSVKSWLQALKMVYLIFSIKPWTRSLARSVLKEEKYYFWDWGMVTSAGGRFENFVAVQLERAIASWNEAGKGPYALHYLRTKEGHEVDFVIASRTRPWLLVEAKEDNTTLAKHLSTFQERLRVPLAIQVVNKRGLCVQKGKGLYIMGADRFLSILP